MAFGFALAFGLGSPFDAPSDFVVAAAAFDACLEFSEKPSISATVRTDTGITDPVNVFLHHSYLTHAWI
jgi:hypothetical protein